MIRTLVEIDISPSLEFLSGIVSEQDHEGILDEATAIQLNRIRTRFLSEIDPEGKPWVPSQAAIRRRKKGGTGTLFDTGRLFRSIQAAATGPNERRIYTDVPYAPLHQHGIGQEQRIFLGFSAEDVEIMNRLVALRMQRLVERSGT